MSVHDSETIEFLLVAKLTGAFFNPRPPASLEFESNSPKIKITIKPDTANDNDTWSWTPLSCRATTTVHSSQHATFVTRINNGWFEAYPGMPIVLPYTERGNVKIEKDGKLSEGFRLHNQIYPPELRTLCETVEQQLVDDALRFLKLLRWQQAIEWPLDFHESAQLFWRTDNGFFHAAPAPYRPTYFRKSGEIYWSNENHLQLRRLWECPDKLIEPLSHELLQDAHAVYGYSPRAALLGAANAVEVGLKTYIAAFAPDTAWMFENLQSPPSEKLFRKYIPELHQKRGTPIAWWPALSGLANEIKRLGEVRNKLAHTGLLLDANKKTVADGEIFEFLEAARDVLYILDVLSGHDWAKFYVRESTRASLDWPKKKGPRIFASVQPSFPVPP
jgi:hypothetical protein